MTTASRSDSVVGDGRATALPSDAVTEPFWQAAKQRRLVAPKCANCGAFRLPPTPFCPQCHATAMEWPRLSGRATVYSFAVVHGFPGLPEVTLVPAVVEFPDAPGVRLVTNVIDIEPDDVRIGMALEVDFHPISEGWMLPVFRVARAAEEE